MFVGNEADTGGNVQDNVHSQANCRTKDLSDGLFRGPCLFKEHETQGGQVVNYDMSNHAGAILTDHTRNKTSTDASQFCKTTLPKFLDEVMDLDGTSYKSHEYQVTQLPGENESWRVERSCFEPQGTVQIDCRGTRVADVTKVNHSLRHLESGLEEQWPRLELGGEGLPSTPSYYHKTDDVTFPDSCSRDDTFCRPHSHPLSGLRRAAQAHVLPENTDVAFPSEEVCFIGKLPKVNRMTSSKSSLIYTTTSVKQCEQNISVCGDHNHLDREFRNMMDNRAHSREQKLREICMCCCSVPLEQFCRYCGKDEKMCVRLPDSLAHQINGGSNNYSIRRSEQLSLQSDNEYTFKRSLETTNDLQEENCIFECSLLSALSNLDGRDEQFTSFPVAYLNKCQRYTLRIGGTPSADRKIKVMLVLTIYSDRDCSEQYEAWQHWYNKTRLELRQRPLRCDQQHFQNITGYPEEIAYNAIVFYWNPRYGNCEIGFSVTGLTTEFKSAKYGKENLMELHLIMLDSECVDRKTPLAKMKCAIKVFSEKQGAERKIREEKRRQSKLGSSQRSKAHGTPILFRTVEDSQPAALFIPRSVLGAVVKAAGKFTTGNNQPECGSTYCAGEECQRKRIRKMLKSTQRQESNMFDCCEELSLQMDYNYAQNKQETTHHLTRSDSSFTEYLY